MDIELLLLTKAMKKVTEYLENMDIDKVDVISDFYWELQSDEIFDIEKKLEVDKNGAIKIHQNDLCIGSLCDDVKELTKDVSGENAVSTVTIDRLAHILEYLVYYINAKVFKAYDDTDTD